MYIKQKKRFFEDVNKVCDRHGLGKNDFTLRINDQALYYQDFELMREEKWSIFLSYKIHKEYLFLFRDHFYISALPIPLKQIENADLSKVLEFVKNNLIEKK